MFGSHLSGFKTKMRSALDGAVRFWAGAAFVVLAMASIQYEEVIAPGVSQMGDALLGVTADFRTRLSSFTL